MAHTCVRGAELMYKYCEENGLPAERVGKIIVAVNEQEHPTIQDLYEKGTANGVKGLEIVYKDQVSALH
jgi:L-2-hydroxyglutarate oxidase LhgO